MRLMTFPLYGAVLLFLGSLASVEADPGHSEEGSSSASSSPSPAVEHIFLIGNTFEVVLESCDSKKIRLYIADRETNQPISKATVMIHLSGSKEIKETASPTTMVGEYEITHVFKEGEKVQVKIIIKEETRAETLALLIPHWPKSGSCQEKSHG